MITLVKQTKLTWAVYCSESNSILRENLTKDQLLDYQYLLMKPAMKKALAEYEYTMSWEEAQMLAGRLTCSECGGILNTYNVKWPLNRQRCTDCLEG